MKNVFTLCFLFFIFFAVAQPTSDLQKTAKNLMKEGDYENAALVLYKLLLNEPNNIAAKKDFAFAHYYKKDYTKSLEISKELLVDSTVDEQVYQLLGLNYKALLMYKDCNILYQNAVTKFPKNGLFYNELGELNLLEKKYIDAIKNWEKGIEVDPNFANNYYNAAMYYSKNNQQFWSIIYGEIFVNLESYTTRTAEIKTTLFDAYKKILYLGNAGETAKNGFEKTVLTTLANTSEAITVATLTAIRIKFILNWFYNNNQNKFSFRLFDQQKYLISEGMFDAYNQWLFGVTINPVQYKIWVDAHKEEANIFKLFQEGRIFKLIDGQYYKK